MTCSAYFGFAICEKSRHINHENPIVKIKGLWPMPNQMVANN
jgi:hypothetical protein